MFSSHHSAAKHTSTQDADPFKTILSTPALRQEFTLLIFQCTNHMRIQLSSTFSASHTSSDSRPSISVRGDDNSAPPPSYNEATSEKGRQDYDRRDEELSSPEMQELRVQALAAMNGWRTKVLRRLGDALDVKADVVIAEKVRRDALTGDELETKTEHRIYATISTTLTKLDREQRTVLLSSLLLLLLSLETYSAYSRVLLCNVCHSMELPQSILSTQESTTAKGLLTAAESMTADREASAAANSNAIGRAWKVGLATVAGAALIGVTGGLAAPLLAAGVGSIFGAIGLGGTAAAGLLGGLAGNVVLIGGLFGAYGGRMTGGVMDKYATEISDFAFLPVIKDEREAQHHLRVGITISGWLTAESEVVSPWTVLSPLAMETFALRWELSLLLQLGSSLTTIAKSYVWGYAKSEVIKRTIFATLSAGLWPLGLLRVAKIADNPFSISLVRADKAGQLLADALIHRAQGERPVNLIGYSLGARVIYSCLQSLARRKAFGIVESAVLIGAPCPSDAADWRSIRAVCVGRVVNVYSTNDFILAFLYRTSRIQFGVAGIEAIEEVAGVESWDVSVWVSGHTKYRYLVGRVLKEIGFEGLNEENLLEESRRLKEMNEVETKEKAAAEAEQDSGQAENKTDTGDLIDIGDERKDGMENAKDSAHYMSDKDIAQRLRDVDTQDGPKQHISDEVKESGSALPPRQSPNHSMSSKPGAANLKEEPQRLAGVKSLEPQQVLDPQDDRVSDTHQNKKTTHVPTTNDETDEEDDPFASRGIRMHDAENEDMTPT